MTKAPDQHTDREALLTSLGPTPADVRARFRASNLPVPTPGQVTMWRQRGSVPWAWVPLALDAVRHPGGPYPRAVAGDPFDV